MAARPSGHAPRVHHRRCFMGPVMGPRSSTRTVSLCPPRTRFLISSHRLAVLPHVALPDFHGFAAARIVALNCEREERSENGRSRKLSCLRGHCVLLYDAGSPFVRLLIFIKTAVDGWLLSGSEGSQGSSVFR